MIDPNAVVTGINTLDWEFAEAETQYLTHGIHRYSGKFIPQIARQAIELISAPGEVVLDVYSGSGTTMLESYLTGRRGIAVDLNPLAVLISRVKVTPIERFTLDSFVSGIENDLKPLLVRGGVPVYQDKISPQLDLFEGTGASIPLFSDHAQALDGLRPSVLEDPRFRDEWFNKWFRAERLFELIAISQRLQREEDARLARVGTIAFSDVLRRASNANSSYPNVMFDKKKPLPPPITPVFIKRLGEVARAVAELPPPNEHQFLPDVHEGDARSLPIADCSVDAIVTHPPYIGSIPYAEYGALSLKWLNIDPRELDKRLTGGRRQSRGVVAEFQEGFQGMFCDAWRVLRNGRYMFMLVGNPVVKGERIDLTEMAIRLATHAGFETVVTKQRQGVNRRANLMGEETLLLFQKSAPSRGS